MLKKTIALVGLTLSLSANAAILDLGNTTLDTDSGREWIDLTNTTYLSYNEVLNKLTVGEEFEGWAIASYTDVQELISHATSNLSLQPGAATNLLSLWGLTGGESGITGFMVSNPSSNPESVSGVTLDTNGEFVYIDNFSPNNQYWANAGTALFRVSEVPVPAASYLFVSALLGLIGRNRFTRK